MTTPAVMSGKRATMRRTTLLIPLVAVLGLTGCGGAQSQEAPAPAPSPTPSASPTQEPFSYTAERCGGELSKDGESMTFRTPGKKGKGGKNRMADIACALARLGAPDRINDLMGATRGLDGTQTDSWDDYEVRWTYHPDNGFFALIAHKPQK